MIFVALGANLPSRFGSPYDTLQKAKAVLSERGIDVVASSRTWLTAPVPISDQPWYHNEVVQVETKLSPYELLEALQTIEDEFGRVRTIRNAPRLLDMDLIAYGDVVINKPELIVPHPRMHQRAFVLLPMSDIVSDWQHPVLDMSLDALISNLEQDQEAVPMDEQKIPA